jgi:hypothetical protein
VIELEELNLGTIEEPHNDKTENKTRSTRQEIYKYLEIHSTRVSMTGIVPELFNTETIYAFIQLESSCMLVT